MADTELLRTFLAIYRAGSLTDAACHRGISQPAASQHLAALERAIGTRLFVRGPNGVTPTQRARELYAQVTEPLDALEAVIGSLRGGDPPPPGPPVRFGSSPEYFSAEVLPRLAKCGVADATVADASSACRLASRSTVGVVQPGAPNHAPFLADGARSAVLCTVAAGCARPQGRAQSCRARDRGEPAAASAGSPPAVAVRGLPRRRLGGRAKCCERVSVIVFDTIAHQHAWRDDVEHRAVQQRGRDAFYREGIVARTNLRPAKHVRKTMRLKIASDQEPPAGVEPATWWVETTCSIQLSYGGTAATTRNLPAAVCASKNTALASCDLYAPRPRSAARRWPPARPSGGRSLVYGRPLPLTDDGKLCHAGGAWRP